MRVMVVPLIVLALTMTASSVAASAPVPASGSFQATLTPVAVRTAAGNTFIDFAFVETFQGTLAGVRNGTGSLIVHPDGTLNAEDSGLFAGSIDGAMGTAAIRVSITGTFAAVTANFDIGSGTAGLAGVHSEGTAAGAATGPTGFSGTYAGQVDFSPN